MRPTNQHPDEQSLLRKYLLRDLGESEQEQIEEQLLDDTGIAEQLAIAQNDLVDDFVNGSLSEEEQQRFKTYFLTTPARMRKLQFATALDKYVAAKTASASAPESDDTRAYSVPHRIPAFLQTYQFKVAFSLVVLLLVVCLAVWIINTKRIADPTADRGNQKTQLALELAKLNNQHKDDSGSPENFNQSPDNIPSFILKPALVRESIGTKGTDITHNTVLARLYLELTSNSYKSYQAVIQTGEGLEVGVINGLEVRTIDDSMFIVLILPVEHFSPGDYQVRLKGITDAGQQTEIGLYTFRIVKR